MSLVQIPVSRALTLHQPWASLVAAGIKRIENRSWAPPPWMLGQRFAIHAGVHHPDAARLAKQLKEDHELGVHGDARHAIIGECRVVAVAMTADEAVRFTDETQRRWFFGKFGWVLEEIRALPEPVFVSGSGRQKLWTIPGDLQKACGF